MESYCFRKEEGEGEEDPKKIHYLVMEAEAEVVALVVDFVQ
jgi:hypothetical protein